MRGARGRPGAARGRGLPASCRLALFHPCVRAAGGVGGAAGMSVARSRGWCRPATRGAARGKGQGVAPREATRSKRRGARGAPGGAGPLAETRSVVPWAAAAAAMKAAPRGPRARGTASTGPVGAASPGQGAPPAASALRQGGGGALAHPDACSAWRGGGRGSFGGRRLEHCAHDSGQGGAAFAAGPGAPPSIGRAGHLRSAAAY